MEDRSTVRRDLNRNKHDLARARSMYERQSKIVEQLRTMDRDTDDAVRLLEALSDNLSSYVAARERLIDRLARLDAADPLAGDDLEERVQ